MCREARNGVEKLTQYQKDSRSLRISNCSARQDFLGSRLLAVLGSEDQPDLQIRLCSFLQCINLFRMWKRQRFYQ